MRTLATPILLAVALDQAVLGVVIATNANSLWPVLFGISLLVAGAVVMWAAFEIRRSGREN